MHKKASLSLSINAIVILVLAIAMLGLGLGFTKGMFARFGAKLDVPPPNIPATAEEPVVLPQEELEVKHGKDFAFAVNFYNDHADDFVNPAIFCEKLGTGIGGGLVPGITDPFDDIIVAPQTVSGGTFKGFKFIIKGDKTNLLTDAFSVCTIYFEVCEEGTGADGKGTNACRLLGTDDPPWPIETKQITIKIT
ncbi:hypothetical protein KY345_06410 [Candidatus Woesearchaeota archaeon]|nr:hypothetical protein [Candidatus Woesearchaeota archaeon]